MGCLINSGGRMGQDPLESFWVPLWSLPKAVQRGAVYMAVCLFWQKAEPWPKFTWDLSGSVLNLLDKANAVAFGIRQHGERWQLSFRSFSATNPCSSAGPDLLEQVQLFGALSSKNELMGLAVCLSPQTQTTKPAPGLP